MVYEVVIWLHFRGGPEMPYWDEVEADAPFSALLALMDRHRLRRVAHAAVRLLPAGPIERWRMGRGFWVKLSGE